jgi:hypothetical protein
MTALIDHPTAAQVMADLSLDDCATCNNCIACTMREETHMEVLALELVHYMPELAQMLADKGRERFLHF